MTDSNCFGQVTAYLCVQIRARQLDESHPTSQTFFKMCCQTTTFMEQSSNNIQLFF